ncbi:MAG: pyridine nucleotide-disulfide oxidoreductase [Anaerolineaceae bacterium]|nr:pyridine nucleotide-disulfide oxidoreductase [Anaerolineaceae bacterium]
MKKHAQYIIIGAGPAGLQLAYFLEKKGRDYLVLDRGEVPGNFFQNNPRHRKLISINKVYTGKNNPDANFRWDWNSLINDDPDFSFKNYTKSYFPHPKFLVNYLQDYANHYHLKIQFDTEINQIRRTEDGFELTDQNHNSYTSQILIVGTGVTKEYKPDIPGFDLVKTYYTHSLNKEDYANKRVLIIGKGNSAFETADHITEHAAAIHVISPNSVKFAWQTHFVGNLRAVNNNFLDTYQLKSQNTVIDGSITNIDMVDGKYVVDIAYSHAKGQTRRVFYDHVISCTGFMFDDSLFAENCKPELAINNRFPKQTTEWESVNIKDLYFIGTIMQACDYKKTMSGFIHGFRHNIRSLSLILDEKYHNLEWEHDTFPVKSENVLQAVLDSVNNRPGIFLQPGFLCDVIVIDDENKLAKNYKDIRKDHVPHSFITQYPHYYTVSLEYGHFEGDPFNVERDPDPEKGDQAAYLHPIIRRFNQGKLVNEHHIQDDLESEWSLPEYVEPAKKYFQAQIS